MLQGRTCVSLTNASPSLRSGWPLSPVLGFPEQPVAFPVTNRIHPDSLAVGSSGNRCIIGC